MGQGCKLEERKAAARQRLLHRERVALERQRRLVGHQEPFAFEDQFVANIGLVEQCRLQNPQVLRGQSELIDCRSVGCREVVIAREADEQNARDPGENPDLAGASGNCDVNGQRLRLYRMAPDGHRRHVEPSARRPGAGSGKPFRILTAAPKRRGLQIAALQHPRPFDRRVADGQFGVVPSRVTVVQPRLAGRRARGAKESDNEGESEWRQPHGSPID
ncbi:MAG: hypothetical protein BWK77_04600 [Verrucomicrobia bacterium A1]|nr:MAG: hypothetical protein BWK77_04600 [Verrucomicrobia bacterium A1]